MRVLLLAHNWDYIPLAPYQIGLELSQLNHYQVSLLLPSKSFAWRYKTRDVNDRFRLYLCPTVLWGGMKKGADPLDLISKTYLLGKIDYDLILAFDSRPSVILPAVYGKIARKTPLVIYWTDWFGRGGIVSQRSGRFYGKVFGRVETFFEEGFYSHADAYAVICNGLKERLSAIGYRGPVHNLPLGCRRQTNAPEDERQLRIEFGLPLDQLIIGCVGTLYRSDWDLLYESFRVVNRHTDACLLLIGKNNFRDQYWVPEHVKETGPLSNEYLFRHVCACDVMAMPMKNSLANNGRWPSKINDYISAGKPVVSTAVDVISELNKMSRFCEIAEDTPEDFGYKAWLLLNDGEKMEAYGANARKLAEGYLNWSNIITELDIFLRNIVYGRSNDRTGRGSSLAWQNGL